MQLSHAQVSDRRDTNYSVTVESSDYLVYHRCFISGRIAHLPSRRTVHGCLIESLSRDASLKGLSLNDME